MLPKGARKITCRVVGPWGNKVASASAEVSALGGFDLKFKLPDTVNLGRSRARLYVSGLSRVTNTGYTHRFKIQEFKRPEFEVKVQKSEG